MGQGVGAEGGFAGKYKTKVVGDVSGKTTVRHGVFADEALHMNKAYRKGVFSRVFDLLQVLFLAQFGSGVGGCG